MKLRTNKCNCDDTAFAGHSIILNFSGKTYRTTYDSKATLVVPLVMLRETVVNGAFVSSDELIAESWNGVPVTINHPSENDEFVTANDPETLARVLIGRIFNSEVSAKKLKAEAWIDIERANEIYPGIIDALESGKPMDVSTGYFSRQEEITGTYNGKKYTQAHHDLKPDHLALLPDEAGACSWEDGCGVRANRGSEMTMKVQEALNVLSAAHTNGWRGSNSKRGDNNDNRQIIADLVSHDETPFTPDDMYGLQSLGTDSIRALRDNYLPGKGNTPMSANAKKVLVAADLEKLGIDAATAVKMVAAQTAEPEKKPDPVVDSAMPKTAAELATLVANAAAEAVKALVPTLLAENERPALLAKVIANTTYTKEVAEKLDTVTLKILAAAIKPVAAVRNYGGRMLPQQVSNNAGDDKIAAAMVPPRSFEKKAETVNGKVN